MTNKELWNQYKEYTEELTVNCRKLAFAAAALCWFFKSNDHQFHPLILIAIGCTVGFFVGDILQYLLAALFLRIWTRSKEKAKWKESQAIDGEYNKPAWLDYPAYLMWWVKICSLLTAYCFIGVYLFRQ